MRMNWDRSQVRVDLNPTLKRFERRMRDQGYRDDSVETYLKAIRLYLKTTKYLSIN
ncbi:MAG: hypothetical protein ABR985_13495 [Methanotrichaceae archaeon]